MIWKECEGGRKTGFLEVKIKEKLSWLITRGLDPISSHHEEGMSSESIEEGGRMDG